MKKRLFAIVGAIALLLAFLTVSVSAMPAVSEEYDSYVEWEISDDGRTLVRYDGEEKTIYKRLIIGQNRYALENSIYYFYNEVMVGNSYYEIISSERYSDTVYLDDYATGELIPYVSGSGDNLINFAMGEYELAALFYDDKYVDTDRAFVEKLDALSADALAISVAELSYADMIEVKTFDSTLTLSHVHGAVYLIGDMPYYVNYDALDNSYFDNNNDFSYNKGVVELYPIKGDLKDEYDRLIDGMKTYRPLITHEVNEMNGILDNGFEFTEESAAVFLIVIIAILGIIAPAIPFTISLIGLVKKKAKHVFITYASFISAAIWLALGFVMLVLIITCI